MVTNTKAELEKILENDIKISKELIKKILKSKNLQITSMYKNTSNAFELIQRTLIPATAEKEELIRKVINTAPFTIEDLKVAEYSKRFIEEGLTDKLYERCLIASLGLDGLYNSLFELIQGVYVKDTTLPERNYDEFINQLYEESRKSS